jgi:hypothetical protein
MSDTTKDELRKEWLEALRSGKYKQAQDALHIPDEGYCCLGVLCEVLSNKGIMRRLGYAYTFDTQDEDGVITMETELQQPIRDLVGLDKRVTGRLIEMNDLAQNSFNEIADYLEKEVFAE